MVGAENLKLSELRTTRPCSLPISSALDLSSLPARNLQLLTLHPRQQTLLEFLEEKYVFLSKNSNVALESPFFGNISECAFFDTFAHSPHHKLLLTVAKLRYSMDLIRAANQSWLRRTRAPHSTSTASTVLSTTSTFCRKVQFECQVQNDNTASTIKAPPLTRNQTGVASLRRSHTSDQMSPNPFLLFSAGALIQQKISSA